VPPRRSGLGEVPVESCARALLRKRGRVSHEEREGRAGRFGGKQSATNNGGGELVAAGALLSGAPEELGAAQTLVVLLTAAEVCVRQPASAPRCIARQSKRLFGAQVQEVRVGGVELVG
jgi:hypothetical protein